MQTLLLTAEEVKGLFNMGDALSLVEGAFFEYGSGQTQMPPKVYLDFAGNSGDLRVMPAYIPSRQAAGVKIVSVNPENPKKGIVTVIATIVLNDPDTGFPLAIMDGTCITNMRTGAGGGVAAKFLSRVDSKVLGLVGAGRQARAQLQAIKLVRDIQEVKVWSQDTALALDLASEFAGDPTIEIEVVPSVDFACDADIICTTTPSREPIVRREWIAPGTHINAIGADAAGKEELDPDILPGAAVICDAWEQASHSGEINIPVSRRLFRRADLRAELGQVVTGATKGRLSDSEITIFDSTGLAIQDLAVARYVYDQALATGTGKPFSLVQAGY